MRPLRFASPLAFLAFAVPHAALATTSNADPSMSQDQILGLIDALQPGDTLVFAPGDYQGREIDLHHKDGSPIVGTSGAPITIQGGMTGDMNLPHITADT